MMVTGKTELAIRLEEALAQHDETEDAQIEVMDDNGVVTLSGYAPDDEAREAAGRIAEGFNGVMSVINDIELGHEDLDGERAILIPPPFNQSNR